MLITKENWMEVRVWKATDARPSVASLEFKNGGASYVTASQGSNMVLLFNHGSGVSYTVKNTIDDFLVEKTGAGLASLQDYSLNSIIEETVQTVSEYVNSTSSNIMESSTSTLLETATTTLQEIITATSSAVQNAIQDIIDNIVETILPTSTSSTTTESVVN